MMLEGIMASFPVVLTEGAIIERLRYGGGPPLHPDILNAAFIYDAAGADRLGALYRRYLDVGRTLGLPMMVFSPTWRANPERLTAAGHADWAAVNTDGVRFLQDIADGYRDDAAAPVLVGALMACRGDAYQPAAALTEAAAAAFHRDQAGALAAANPDVIKAATLPACSEAVGMARALAATGRPYILGVVLRPDGTLLDGTPLPDAVAAVDAAADPAPVCYMVDCTHPATALSAVAALGHRWTEMAGRVAGIQANGSDLPPEALDDLDHIAADPPEVLAAAVARLHRNHGFHIVGGCCGTDERHVAAIGRRVRTGG